jgi:hypothetical protein
MMTPRNDLLGHAVDLFPAPEGSVAEVERDVARRHRTRRVAAISVVVAIWVAIGVVALTLRTDAAVPIQPPTPTPTLSPTVAPGMVDGPVYGWPGASRNEAGIYSWRPGHCLGTPDSCYTAGWMHNAYEPGSGDISIVVDGVADHIRPHEGTSVTVFGFEGSYLRYTGDPTTGGPRASCEQWMVDIQGTTVTIKLCARPGAPADEIAEAHEIIESIRVESGSSDSGIRLILTLTTNTWDSG